MVVHSRVLLVTHGASLIGRISLANLLLILALFLHPFSESSSWSLACWTAEWFWCYMQTYWEISRHARQSLTITGDSIPPNEPAIVISNHLGYSDYYLVQALASRAGMLGRCRYFVKREIVRIPLFGWAFWTIGMILISRNWANDASLVEQAFERIKKNQHDCWIVLYPEGTRRTSRKLLESKAFARSHGKTELQNLLFPRTKGFAAIVQGLRESHVKHLYDLTFLYTSPKPDVTHIPDLKEQLSCPDLARAGYKFWIHVRRIPLDELPKDEEGLRRWCEEAWVRKDELLCAQLGQNASFTYTKEENTKKKQ